MATASLLLAVASPAYATEEDAQAWTTLNLNTQISPKWNANLELQARFTEDLSEYGQRFIRPSLNYKHNDIYTFTLGYADVLTDPENRAAFSEYRPWQQVSFRLFKNDYGTQLSGRTRFEQRFVEGGDDIGLRLRQQVRLEVPIEAKSTTKWLAWNETFYGFNDTDWGQRADFDQTRNFVGLMLPIQPDLAMEAGYLNQTIFQPGEDRMNHALSTSVTYRF